MSRQKNRENLFEFQRDFNETINVIKGDADIEIPKDLDDSLSMKLEKLKRKKKFPKKFASVWVAAVVLVIAVTTIVTINPTLRSFAERLPVIGTFVCKFYKDESIEQAQKSGFIKMTNLTKEQDGLIFDIGELYFDGLRFSINTKICGDKLSEYLNKGSYPILSCSYIISTDKDNGQSGMLSELFKVREGDKNYIYSRAEKTFTESEYKYILNNNKQFEVKILFEASGISSQFSIPVILSDYSGIISEEKNIKYNFNGDYPIENINIDKLLSSPTLSQMYYKVNMKKDTSFLGFQNAYIIDKNGKKYTGEQEYTIFKTFPDENYIKKGKDEFKKINGFSSRNTAETGDGFKLNFVPAFYSANSNPEKFCFEGLYIKQRKKVSLDLKSKFPQNITFDDKVVSITYAEYKNGKLSIVMDKSTPDVKSIYVNYGDSLDPETKRLYYSEGIDNKFILGCNNTDKDGNELYLEKKDTYIITVEAEYVINKKIEIPLKNKF
ncbi:MAG: DUF4179 domain-containing protein [Bacillota bacterium]|nr:DUF4179 domain-containing protein [Bacillota bacterium]